MARYFKTGVDDYGYGDVFLGVSVPRVRAIARSYAHLPLRDVERLLRSKVHEERLLALVLLVERYAREPTQRAAVYRFYAHNLDRVNNWDLVDTSAPQIVGGHLASRDRSVLDKLSRSPNLWRRRVAIVATQHFIRNGEFADTLRIAEVLLRDPEDLIHKATGWMLREVGNRDRAALDRFLSQHAASMPRTMLRYAIEKHSVGERAKWMARSEAQRRKSLKGSRTVRPS